ncbi:MAG: methylornithine synthase PylB [Candidatus Methanomethylophilus sp.]|nr:methylornithine synthase PylB [Methanomethylophilus sp.]
MDVRETLQALQDGKKPEVADVETLLTARGSDEQALFAAAREKRDRQFGNKLYAYGFVYFSTYCQNNCTFCYFRHTNDIDRYRKTPAEIYELAADLKDAGIDLVDLTMGEDPQMYADDYAELLDIVARVHSLDISIMCSPGAVRKDIFPRLKAVGGNFYAVYQETHNRALFAQRRIGQDYDFRANQRKWAHEAGMLAEDGMMCGIGESLRDRAETILAMGAEGCEQIRAMAFVPQAGTPMAGNALGSSEDEIRCIAVMRLLFPDRLIPATLDVEGTEGMKKRLNAGANVITSIVVPKRHLAGVAQPEKDIENGSRSVEHVFSLVEQMGKKVATQQEYASFIAGLQAKRAVPQH